MWRIRHIHIRVEKPTSWVNSRFICLQGTVWASERTHRPACLWALPCFSPCQAQRGPSLSSGEKRGLDLVRWHHFLVLKHGEEMENFPKTSQATRHHAATLSFDNCFPDALKSQAVSYFCHEKKRIICVMRKSRMCHFINTTLSHCRPLSKKAPRGKNREYVLTIGGLCDIDQMV